MKHTKIAVVLILIILCGYGVIKLYRQPSTSNTPGSITSELHPESLTGIWQANGSMAAGWANRYHFYPNGVFHFYPNQMIKTNLTENSGNWKIRDNSIILNGVSYTLEFLGIRDGDAYPSILIDNTQYWQFSTDPTQYGQENFPDR